MFYYWCLSLLFTFPVGGVGNQVHKLWLAVSFFLLPVSLCGSIISCLNGDQALPSKSTHTSEYL